MFNNEKEELRLLREELQLLKEIQRELKPKLSVIKIAFRRNNVMAEGPVTLTVGQKTVASVDGFDQNGAPFTGVIPTPSWSIDNSTFDSIAADTANPSNEDVASVAVGVANLSVSVTSAEGKVLTDTESVTNVAAASVLSSVKINFSTPA
jgi:hypothetical protein